MQNIPQIPDDADMPADERAGFDAFAAGRPFDHVAGAPWRRGWHKGWARCYGKGVMAFVMFSGDTVENPFPQFSGAWEAWAQGFEDAIYL